MALDYLSLRNYSQASTSVGTFSVSTLTGKNALGFSTIVGNILSTNTLTTSTLQLTSTMISLGPNTQSTIVSASQGSYAAGSWQTVKSGLTNARKLAMSLTGQYQLMVSATTSDLWLSSDSGVNWTALGASQGLPVLTGSAQWSGGAISASGQQITLAIQGGSLWFSSDYGRTFAVSPQNTPDVWLQLNGSTADLMGVSTVTPTGSPTYIHVAQPGFTEQALQFNNTAGAMATTYLRASWAGSSQFTLSFWFNPQAIGVNYQYIASAYNGIFAIVLNSSNQLSFIFPSGGGANYSYVLSATSFITINTWYYISVIFKADDTCSLYLNNTLIGTALNTQGVGSMTTSHLTFGGFDTGTVSNSFNGYIADIRLNNSAVPYVPVPHLAPVYWLPMEGSVADSGSYSIASIPTPTIYLPFEGTVTDSQGVSTVTATGSPAYTTSVRVGATGTRAINLVNTPFTTATQYVRGTWTAVNTFTVSLWVNFQSIGVQQNFFAAYSGNGFVIYLTSGSNLALYISGATVATAPFAVTTNTWYYVHASFVSNGTGSFYVNNSLIGTYACGASPSGTFRNVFSIGCNDFAEGGAFNGYIDDVRIYHSSVPYVPVSVVNTFGTMAYVPGVVSQTALSLANTAGETATNYVRGGWSVTPTYTLSTWFNVQSYAASNNQFVCSVTPSTGEFILYIDVITRNVKIQIGNTQIGFSGIAHLNTWYYFYIAVLSNTTAIAYLNDTPLNITYPPASSTPNGFSLGTLNITPGTYAFNGYIDDFRIYNGVIPYSSLIPQNYSHLTMSGNGIYQMAATSIGRLYLSSNSGASWNLQPSATTPGAWSSLSASYSGNYLTALSQPVVQPNQTGLAVTTWSQQGVTYTVSVSSTFNSNFVSYYLFDYNNITGWNSAIIYDSSGAYTGTVSTTIQGIGAVSGEWFQLQTSIPLILSTFQIRASGWWQVAKTYYIVGSNDGSTWFPIQYGVFQSNPYSSNYMLASTVVNVNYSGIQNYYANTGTNLTTTAYATTTHSYLYFRMIAPNIFNGLGASDTFSFSEWLPNFLGGSIVPNRSGLATESWTQSGATWIASASSAQTGVGRQAYKAFDNSASTPWSVVDTPTAPYSTSTGLYQVGSGGSFSTIIQGMVGAVAGEWLQLQVSIPMVLQSYRYSCNATWRLPKIYYIVGSNDGLTWYPIQYCNIGTNPFTTNGITLANSVTVNYSGTQGLYGNTVGVCTTRAYGAYTTQAYTYFRVVVTSIFSGGSDGGMEYTEWTPFFVAGQTSSSNFGSTWAPTIQTGDAFNVTKNVTVVSAGTGFATLPAFTPLSTGLSFSARVTINSGTPGQWARVFDAGSSYPTPLHSIMMYFTSANRIGVNMERNNIQNIITSTTILVVGTEYHVSWVITSSGISKLYINAIEEASGTQPINIQNYYSFFIGKSNWTADPYGNITVRDFRMFNRSLSASEVTSLYQNLNYGSSTNSILSLSKSGQYSLAGDGLVARIDNNYLTTYSTNAFSVRTPPNINAPIVDTAVSQTGQYMVLVTAGVTNNVYYSRDYGATFTALTLGSSAMVSCSISHDGSYLTVSNGTTVYRLNSNSTGYSLALGSQAGQINQALNAIAVGSQAGQRNQSANSVVLNASGTAVNTGSDGFYVAPIASSASAATTNIGLLGYGEDKQVVQTTVTVLAGSGNVGIGTTNPQYQLQLTGAAYFPVDAIQQAPFLSPSPANAPLIKAWMNEIVITSSPVTGLSPFWSSALSYSTIAGAPGNYAYNGGVLLPDGRVVFVPYNATTIGLYNPATHAYSTIAAGAPGNAAYAGGVLLPDGRVVFVPSNATTIGLFNPTTNTYSTIAAGAPGTLAYFGGYLLSDGRVLFAPRRATTIGFFNPSNNTYSTLSGLPGNDAYIGGVLLPDGRVVFVPFSGSTIGLFDPITNTYSTVSISSVSAAYIGGVLLPDGRVVFIPFTSSVIGIFDPATNIFRTVSGLIGGAYYCGTLLPDGRVLFIPYSSSVFGLFNPTTNSFTTLSGAPGVDAYSAGVLLPDGRVVLVPLLSSVIGIFHQSIPASPEMCLHPFFNKF